MTKGYNQVIEFDPSSLTNCDEESIFSKNESQKIIRENKKSASNHNFRQSTKKFINKLRKISFIPTSSNHEEQKSNDISKENEKNSSDTSKTIPPSPISSQSLLKSNEEPKLKGILKNSTKIRSYTDPTNNPCDNHNDIQSGKSHSETCLTTDKKENSNDVISSAGGSNSLDSTSDSSKLVKHVMFSDKISKIRYEPSKSVDSPVALSSHRQKKLKKLQRKDSLNLPSMNLAVASSIDSSKCQEFCESSDDDDDDK